MPIALDWSVLPSAIIQNWYHCFKKSLIPAEKLVFHLYVPDRIARKPDIARLLRQGGYKTLTVASDAASHRLRKDISKGTLEKHLFSCAEQAREHRYKVLKIYMMVGLPDETEEDLDELIRFALEISKIHPIVFGIAPFVPKKKYAS